MFLLFFGLGMVAGTWAAGGLADWSVFRSLLIGRPAWSRPRALVAAAPAGWLLLPVAFAITSSAPCWS